jgi:transcriptional regulator with XRE-family HTH domain
MERLKQLRKSKGLSLKKLGTILGVSESTVSLYESGHREPDFRTLKNMADYFNVTTDYLLERTDIENLYDDEGTVTGHDEREAFTEEELEEIENFKEYVISKRKKKNNSK